VHGPSAGTRQRVPRPPSTLIELNGDDLRRDPLEVRAFVMVAVADAIERSDAVVITGNRLAVDDAGARAQADQRLHDQGNR
jgi:hypothetical protein